MLVCSKEYVLPPVADRQTQNPCDPMSILSKQLELFEK